MMKRHSPRKDNDRHNHRITSPLPKGVVLRIRDINQKAEFFCHSPENYLTKIDEFIKNGIKFTCSHSREKVQKMITV